MLQLREGDSQRVPVVKTVVDSAPVAACAAWQRVRGSARRPGIPTSTGASMGAQFPIPVAFSICQPPVDHYPGAGPRLSRQFPCIWPGKQATRGRQPARAR